MLQVKGVLDEFEKTAWAGLDTDRYSWTAVLHREQGGGVHVHILTARCDLETGRSLNIAPPYRHGRAGGPPGHHPDRAAGAGPARLGAVRPRRHRADAAGPGAVQPV